MGDNLYKAAFSNIDEENLLIVIVLPFSVPDNIVKSTAREAKFHIDELLKSGFASLLDCKPSDHKDELVKINNRLNQIFTTIFY